MKPDGTVGFAIAIFIAIIVFGSLSGCAQVDPCARGCTSATVEYEAQP